jgi:hypothetical protein
MSAKEIIEIYTSRWSLEVTFEEVRSYLKLQTTRGWKENTVLRMAPCLFGLYSGVVLLYQSLPAKWKNKILIDWDGKDHLCFSDVIITVRRYLWMEWIFENLPGTDAIAKLSPKLKNSLLYALAPAA